MAIRPRHAADRSPAERRQRGRVPPEPCSWSARRAQSRPRQAYRSEPSAKPPEVRRPSSTWPSRFLSARPTSKPGRKAQPSATTHCGHSQTRPTVSRRPCPPCPSVSQGVSQTATRRVCPRVPRLTERGHGTRRARPRTRTAPNGYSQTMPTWQEQTRDRCRNQRAAPSAHNATPGRQQPIAPRCRPRTTRRPEQHHPSPATTRPGPEKPHSFPQHASATGRKRVADIAAGNLRTPVHARARSRSF